MKSIAENAFQNCANLEIMTINSEDYKIAREAFCHCDKLRKLFYKSQNGIHSEAFKNCSDIDFISIENKI